MLQFKKEIGALLSPLVDMPIEEIEAGLEVPPDPMMGEYAFPCHLLSRRLKKPPVQISQSLAGQISPGGFLKEAVSSGPYLNLYIDRQKLAAEVLTEVLTKADNYGYLSEGEGETVVIDFSAPNIAKPFGIGHLRSTVIGNSLAKIYRALGYKVVGINYLGDWGTQFGKLIVAFDRWGEGARLEEDPIHYLFQLYVRYHKEAEENPALDDESRQKFRELETGDPDVMQLWERFRSLSLKEFQRIYNFMGVTFDSWQGESYYNNMLEKTIKLVKEKGIAKESDGALVADLEPYGLPSCLLQKSDGGALYITRDLAAAIHRYETYGFSKLLYVVGSEQTLHFKQLFKILELLGFPWAGNCRHVPFGLISFKEGRMSTREGNIVFLEDLLTKSIELAHNIIREKNPDLRDKEEAAKEVGLGAIIFGDLVNDRIKNVEFDWDSALDFSGETAPYIQYSFARINSILRKISEETAAAEEIQKLAEILTAPEEEQLVITMSRFSEQIRRAAEELKPSVLAHYLINLARDFSKFYHNCPVLSAEEDIKKARLLLISSARIILRSGLSLLGVGAPSEM